MRAKKPLTPHEENAAAHGGQVAGRYLDSLDKSDLADLTGEEWAEFCKRLFLASCEYLQEQADAEVPF